MSERRIESDCGRASVSSDVIDAYETHKSKLIGIAYRIVGSVSESEDIVHETFIKWFDADHGAIRSPYLWLVTVTTRLSLDYLRKSSVKRQSYVGEWLPEPFIEDKDIPENEFELDESVTMALLILLDKLSPPERASFILHDLFCFNFDEIGEILNKSGMSCRKLASRARVRIEKDKVKHRPSGNEHRRVVSAFFNAVKNGDMNNLVTLLKDDVVFHSDGGGKAIAALEVLRGSDKVAAFLFEKLTANCTGQATKLTQVWYNGSPGYVVFTDGIPVSAFNFEIDEQKINKIHVLRNPDKLQPFKRYA